MSNRIASLLSLSAGVCLAIAPIPSALAGEWGRPPIEVHRSADFGGGPTSYSVIPMPDGRIAVSNTRGLAVFDGSRWRLYPHPEGSRGLLSIARTEHGDFCGGFPGEIGCYRPTPEGGYRWQSLHDRLPATMRQYNKVATATYDHIRKGVWFAMQTQMVLVPDALDQAPTLLSLPAAGWRTFGNTFIVYGSSLGLFRISAKGPPTLEQLAPIEDIETKWLIDVHDVGHGRLLAMQLGGRVSLIESGRATPTWVDGEAHRRQAIPSAFRAISGGRYAIGFQRGPLTIVDSEGRELQRFGAANGISETAITGLAEDREGGLWLTQSNVITRIDQASATSFYGPEFGSARVSSFYRWRSRPFITSQFRLLALDSDSDPAQFRPYEPAAHLQLGLAVERGERLYAMGEAFFEFEAPGAAPKLLGGVGHVSVSRLHEDRLYTLIRGQAAVVTASAQGTAFEPLPEPPFAFTDVVEQNSSTLWLHRENGQLARLRVGNDGKWQAPALVAATELPARQFFLTGGRDTLWVATTKGVWRLHDDETRFVPATELPVEMRDGYINTLFEDEQGHLWMQSAAHSGVAWREGNAWRWDPAPLAALDPRVEIFHFAREGDLLWVMKADGLARIDLAQQRRDLPQSVPILTGLWDSSAGRALSLSGHGELGSRLRIEFALPAMQRRDGNALRFRLSGFDDDFSPWSARSEYELADLAPGAYAFEVQGRDSAGRVSSAELLRFQIPTPWYRQPWAWAAYLAIATLALIAAARFGARRRQRQMLVRQQALERIVAERTAELHLSNRQLAEQADRLQTIDRLKTRFFVNVGHEFRTPLTLVLGPLDDLLRDARERLSERMRNQLQLAQRNARRVLDLIVELLDVNRLEQGHLQLSVAIHDLVPLLRRVMAENAPLVERFGQTLTIECSEIASAPSAIDPVQIERALGNLIGNAAKYSPRGTTISLSLAQSGQYWLIAVSDEGRGISPEALPHVFDRFFQSDGSTTASGYGIGLSLVREIASAHGGEVTASSTLGVGSRFELKLAAAAQLQATEVLAPVDDAEPSDSATATAAISFVETDRGHRERVLVVDDHDDLRQRVRELLAHRFEVIEAADGDQAWQLARDELPDLIVSDVMMPGCDGVDLSKRLRSHPDTQAIGILLLTAKAGSEHAVAGLRAGANDYLSKPFDASELLARCEAIVAHARRLQHRLAAAAPALPPESTVVDHPDRRWRQRLDQSIAAYLHESQFDVEALAKCMHADRTQLFRKCKELLGQSPSDYLRDARLAHGHRLLEQAAGSISEVAYASGFDSLSSFTRAFKVRYGVPPSQVRRAA